MWLFGWALLLALCAIDAALLPRRRDVVATLTPPDTLYVGEPGELGLTLSLLAGGGVTARVKLDVSGNVAPIPDHQVRLTATPTTTAITLHPRRRGLAEIETAWLRIRGPFGMVDRTVRVELNRPLDVVPNIRGVRRMAIEYASPMEMRAGLRIEQYGGDGSEFDSLREFMPGLDHRAIDWKASARHAKLLVRHFRAERNRQIVIALDAGHLMAEPIGLGGAGPASAAADIPRLDHAIHAGLLLAYFSVRSGDRVGLFVFDERPRGFSEPRGGMASFRAMLKVSGGVRYTASETNYTLGLTTLMGRLNRRSLVVVVTDFVDTVTAELMIENVQRLARRHLVLFVSLRDPRLAEIAAAEPHDLVALERAVVAESLLREREVVINRLRRQGVLCVDASPRDVGVELLNRYLAIKRRELIG